jgi:hypothetical protein
VFCIRLANRELVPRRARVLRRIATALRAQHDVRAADEERELDGFDDERLLALATEQGLIMVTWIDYTAWAIRSTTT